MTQQPNNDFKRKKTEIREGKSRIGFSQLFFRMKIRCLVVKLRILTGGRSSGYPPTNFPWLECTDTTPKKIKKDQKPSTVDDAQAHNLEDASNDSITQQASDRADRVLIVDFPWRGQQVGSLNQRRSRASNLEPGARQFARDSHMATAPSLKQRLLHS